MVVSKPIGQVRVGDEMFIRSGSRWERAGIVQETSKDVAGRSVSIRVDDGFGAMTAHWGTKVGVKK